MGDCAKKLETVPLLLERIVLPGLPYELNDGRVKLKALAFSRGFDNSSACLN